MSHHPEHGAPSYTEVGEELILHNPWESLGLATPAPVDVAAAEVMAPVDAMAIAATEGGAADETDDGAGASAGMNAEGLA